ncbi:hypothetical protein BKA70DRAFT_1441711 [Coprinopsis sp. MPI-PUGE-AT-0042]|nr:hypothetical protein BKA70DRAFT_1441711 [Coprinopsis sp. MPI-PUGE-AT-0042]
MAFRTENPRVDDEQNRKLVAQALREIEKGYSAVGDAVEKGIKARSLHAIENAFSSRLQRFNFNIYSALVVDPLHEVEIGVWKSLYQHLLRLLQAFEKRDGIAELDQRYRDISSFGRDTICRFSTNASDMKRKAARDYEDLLQCSLPVFEALLPSPHNEIVGDLLYALCEWHALAKLRMHHDLTLERLESATVELGSHFRRFQVETCAKVKTFELPSEAEARTRRAASRDAQQEGNKNVQQDSEASSRRPKAFSLSTPKYHALGHYAQQIRHFGTVDSFTSEIGETNHPVVKTWYKRTDRKNVTPQIAAIERQRARLSYLKGKYKESRDTTSNIEDADVPGLTAPIDSQYHIGGGKRFYNLHHTFVNHPTLVDPALEDFIPKLKMHLLPRILHLLAPTSYQRGDVEGADWRSVDICNGRIYRHELMRLKYTTYDVRRQEDILRVSSEASVMTLDAKGKMPSSSHPYRYARVLGIFHAEVRFVGPLSNGEHNYDRHRIDFLWVRWYTAAPPSQSVKLDRLQFGPLSSPQSFGFLEPWRAIRAVHLIPQFSAGRREDTTTSEWTGKKKQWRFYFVNRYADRDMYMRFHLSLAIGHQNIRRQFGFDQEPEASVEPPALFPPLDASYIIEDLEDSEVLGE